MAGVKGLNGPQASSAPTDFTQKGGGRGLRPEQPPCETCWIFNEIFPRWWRGAIWAFGLDMLDFSSDLQKHCIRHPFFCHKKFPSWKLFILHQKKKKKNSLYCKQIGKSKNLRGRPKPGPLRPAISGLQAQACDTGIHVPSPSGNLTGMPSHTGTPTGNPRHTGGSRFIWICKNQNWPPSEVFWLKTISQSPLCYSAPIRKFTYLEGFWGCSIFTRFFLAIFTQGNSWDVLSSLAKNSIPCKIFCWLTQDVTRISN